MTPRPPLLQQRQGFHELGKTPVRLHPTAHVGHDLIGMGDIETDGGKHQFRVLPWTKERRIDAVVKHCHLSMVFSRELPELP